MKNHPLREAPLLRLAVCLMVGIAVMYAYGPCPLWPLFVGLVVILVIALLLWKLPGAQSVVIAACFCALGALLVERHRQELAVDWPEGKVVFEAVVLTEPVEKPRTMAVDILLTGNGRKLKCYLAKDERSRRLRVGDGLRLCAVIQPNREWRSGTFDYRLYLEVHGFTGVTFAGGDWQKREVSLRGVSRLQRTRLFFLRQRSRLLERLRMQGLADDAYAVVAAMTLGDKSALSGTMKDVYSRTGASHVLALSGLHLGIIYTLLSLLVVGRRWRVLSQLLVVLSVWAFVFLVGMSVSVVRAAVMISTYALLSLGHRDKMSVNTLAFTAIIMLMVNPYALFDVGFQLSYLAVFAILVFLPLSDRLVSHEFLMSHGLLRWLWGMSCVSCAAQIGVAPLIAYHFGRFSTFFLLTNFVVVPATMLILYLSLATLMLPPMAPLLLTVVGLLNTLLTRMAAIPGTSIEGLNPSILQVSMVYVIIAALYLLMLRWPTSVRLSDHG